MISKYLTEEDAETEKFVWAEGYLLYLKKVLNKIIIIIIIIIIIKYAAR